LPLSIEIRWTFAIETSRVFSPVVRRSLQTTEPALTYVPALEGVGRKGAETVAVS
jgi:hypothetical protein